MPVMAMTGKGDEGGRPASPSPSVLMRCGRAFILTVPERLAISKGSPLAHKGLPACSDNGSTVGGKNRGVAGNFIIFREPRERVNEFVNESVCVCVRACVRACLCVRECVCV